MNLVEDHTILSVVVGSRAYGLAGTGSDHDRRGVYAAATERFCTLALQANPTILEYLWSPIVEHATDDGSSPP